MGVSECTKETICLKKCFIGLSIEFGDFLIRCCTWWISSHFPFEWFAFIGCFWAAWPSLLWMVVFSSLTVTPFRYHWCLRLFSKQESGFKYGIFLERNSPLTEQHHLHFLYLRMMHKLGQGNSMPIPRSIQHPHGVRGELTRAFSGRNHPTLLSRTTTLKVSWILCLLTRFPGKPLSAEVTCFLGRKRKTKTPMCLFRQHYAVFISFEKWHLNFSSPEWENYIHTLW